MGRRWFLVGLLALGACGRTDTSIPDGLGLRAAEVICGRRFACCQPSDLRQLYGDNLDDVAACRIYYGTQMEGVVLPFLRSSVEKGRLLFDRERFEACLGDLEAASCETLVDLRRTWVTTLLGCGKALLGQVPHGAACRWDAECSRGFCSFTTESAEGICRAWPGVDEPCAEGACEAGLFCDEASETCRRRRPDGAECWRGNECEGGGCAEGACVSLCVGGGPGEGASAGLLEEAGAAMVEAECARAASGAVDELSCRLIHAQKLGWYILPARHRALRADEASLVEAELETCLSSIAEASCEAHAPSAPIYASAPGCDAWLAGSVPCRRDVECLDGFCDTEFFSGSQTCEPLPSLGDPCQHLLCARGARCQGGVCVEAYAPGEPCLLDGDCLKGGCVGAEPAAYQPGRCAELCEEGTS